MSKLTDFYAHKAALIEKNLPVDAQQDHGDGKITGTVLLIIRAADRPYGLSPLRPDLR